MRIRHHFTTRNIVAVLIIIGLCFLLAIGQFIFGFWKAEQNFHALYTFGTRISGRTLSLCSNYKYALAVNGSCDLDAFGQRGGSVSGRDSSMTFTDGSVLKFRFIVARAGSANEETNRLDSSQGLLRMPGVLTKDAIVNLSPDGGRLSLVKHGKAFRCYMIFEDISRAPKDIQVLLIVH